MSDLKISLIICTYNREKFLPDALNSIKKQLLPCSEFEIVIVNNNCTDRTPEIVQDFKENNPQFNVVYVIEENQGLAYARNKGMDVSSAPLICYIDDDVILPADYLTVITEYCAMHPEVTAIGGKIFPKYESKEPKWLSKYTHAYVGHLDLGDLVHEYTQKYPPGGNMAIKREEALSIRFNVALGRKGNQGLASEEKDFFERLKAKGATLHYVPQMWLNHCIDDFRLEKWYIRKLARGYGISERMRADQYGFSFQAKKLIEFIIKFGASLVFWVFFTLKQEASKGVYLVIAQYSTLIGYLTKKYPEIKK